MGEKEIKALTDQINSELVRISGLYAEMQKEVAKKAGEERITDLINKANESEVKVKTLSEQLDKLELSLKDQR